MGGLLAGDTCVLREFGVRVDNVRCGANLPPRGGGGEGGIAILTRFLLERRLQNLLKEARIRVIVRLGVVG